MTESSSIAFGLVAGSTSDGAPGLDALVTWLRERADLSIEARDAGSYEALAKSILEGTSDLAWLPPIVYARLAEAVNPVGGVARDGQSSYSSALVVRRDGAFRALGDLRGARAGWVDPWSAAGFVVPRIELVRMRVDPRTAFRTERFYGNHRQAMLALQRGECDVAGTYARADDAGKIVSGAWSEIEGLDVRALAKFGPIPPDVIAVRRNLLPATYERIVAALKRAFADDDARALLRSVLGGDELHEGIEPGHETLRLAVEQAISNGLFD